MPQALTGEFPHRLTTGTLLQQKSGPAGWRSRREMQGNDQAFFRSLIMQSAATMPLV